MGNKILSKILSSKTVIAVIIASCVLIDIDFGLWRKTERVIEWDVHSYYAYLPALFIFKDLPLKNMPDYNYAPKLWYFWPDVAPNGGNVIKTSMGLAFLYAPFFFVAHHIALFTDYESTGFSEPYKLALVISTIFFLAIGIIYLRKILMQFFSEHVTTITILLLGLGTNLLCYSSVFAPYPHTYNFTLFAMFIFYSIRWYETGRYKYTLIMGLLLGLISLIRPTNILIILFFILYGVIGLKDLSQRLLALIINWKLIVTFIICIIIVWLPQIIYWKMVSGQYFYYAYGDERFFFDNPIFLQGLFGFRKGWFIYTPMMLFAMVGLIFMMRKYRAFQPAIIIFTVLNLYIIFSWWCWWYGGCFGQRSIVDSYALYAIPLAAFVTYISKKKIYLKVITGLIFAFFTWLNIFNTYQYQYQSLHYDGMTMELYFKQFGKLEIIDEYYDLADPPDYEQALMGDR